MPARAADGAVLADTMRGQDAGCMIDGKSHSPLLGGLTEGLPRWRRRVATAEPAPRSIDLHDRLAQFILAEVTIVITRSPGKAGFEDGQSTPVLQFAGCPHGHFAFAQITPVTIDQPYQACYAITSESRSGAVGDFARMQPDGAFQH